MKRGAGIEAVKTAAIVILAASAVFLASLTGIFDDFAASLKRVEAQPHTGGAPSGYGAAAFPQSAAVSAAEGLRCGIRYDSAGMEELYRHVSTAIGEAIGSAAEVMSIDESEWRQALRGEGLYLDYEAEIPFAALALWLGTEPGGTLTGSVRRILLIQGADGGVDMCYQSADGFYRCGTMSRWDVLSAQTVDFLPNGASFAFEKDSLSDADPYCIINEGGMSARAVRAAAGKCPGLGEVFGVSMYNGYTETDGTVVYPEDVGTVKLGTDGTVSYTAGDDGGIYADGIAEMIECARSVLERLREGETGDESLRFTGAEEDGDTVRLSFAYFADGIRVTGTAGDAAAVEFENGRLTQLTVLPRIYTVTEHVTELLPQLQAAAAAGSMSRGASASLIYGDGGGETLIYPAWKMSNGY